MVKNPQKFPEVGEVVIAHVEEVESHHVYVLLEDYEGNTPGGKARGMIHISEIASHWVRNIHDFIKENTKVVLKVLRVDERKGHIDLSLRRVTAQQKKEKIKNWKRSVKAENILNMLAEKVGVTLDEVFDRFGFAMMDAYRELLGAFEAVKEEGIGVLDDFDIPDDWKQILYELIDQNVELRRVKITAEFKIEVPTSDGVEVIKKALVGAMKIKHEPSVEVQIVTLGAPRYQLNIIAKYYEDAEDIYGKIEKKVKKVVESGGGKVELVRTGSGTA
ncbi:MAG: translation initiation factor IF-2 subunit alpha [Promethearchaeota archaeon]